MDLVVMMGSEKVSVPTSIKLNSEVSESLAEIVGDFSAGPLVPAYSGYSEQGSFRLYR
ncbi:MAG: hypothetical protein SWK76_00985 [Actinomycetota bacterium]|nr:hypothetical protein [Actinomycetota bacterium]